MLALIIRPCGTVVSVTDFENLSHKYFYLYESNKEGRTSFQ